MNRRIVIGTTAALAAAGGSAGAIAATTGGEARKAEDAVLADAAKRLGVGSAQLRSALSAAQQAQLDQTVEDGTLTQAQADAMAQRMRASGRVLGFHGGPGHHRGGHGLRMRGPGLVADAAKALGITGAQLHERLHDGASLADVAKDEGKSPRDVKAAMRTSLGDRLAAGVKAGRLTGAQRDAMLRRFDEHFDRLAAGDLRRGRHGKRGHHGAGSP